MDSPDLLADESDERLFPRFGLIAGTAWGDIARTHCRRHDPNQPGALYAGWCLRNLVWRCDRHHGERFEQFCHDYGQRFPRPAPTTSDSTSRYGAFPQTGSIAETAFGELARQHAGEHAQGLPLDRLARRYRERLIVKSDPGGNRHPFRTPRGRSFREDFIRVCIWGYIES